MRSMILPCVALMLLGGTTAWAQRDWDSGDASRLERMGADVSAASRSIHAEPLRGDAVRSARRVSHSPKPVVHQPRAVEYYRSPAAVDRYLVDEPGRAGVTRNPTIYRDRPVATATHRAIQSYDVRTDARRDRARRLDAAASYSRLDYTRSATRFGVGSYYGTAYGPYGGYHYQPYYYHYYPSSYIVYHSYSYPAYCYPGPVYYRPVYHHRPYPYSRSSVSVGIHWRF